jgi:hypothetical protein
MSRARVSMHVYVYVHMCMHVICSCDHANIIWRKDVKLVKQEQQECKHNRRNEQNGPTDAEASTMTHHQKAVIRALYVSI